MKSVSITVTGKVQGVFFRASAKDIAEKLDVRGFAQNMPNGSVYIEAEGDEENLKQFIGWCQQGPPRASVSNVNVVEAEPKSFQRFDIKR